MRIVLDALPKGKCRRCGVSTDSVTQHKVEGSNLYFPLGWLTFNYKYLHQDMFMWMFSLRWNICVTHYDRGYVSDNPIDIDLERPIRDFLVSLVSRKGKES